MSEEDRQAFVTCNASSGPSRTDDPAPKYFSNNDSK